MKNLESQKVNWKRKFNPYSGISMQWAGVALAAASTCYVPTAVAQSSGSNLTIEEIVVTVRRRVEMEQDVPIAMKAMSEDFMRTNNITEIQDLGTKIPSLRISGAGGSVNEPIISLRGQRPAESAFNQEQAVPMYFNEVAMIPAQGSNMGMYDLQNVQVLKGPQGTLFGKNSTGGALMMTPKRPGTEVGGYIEVKAGDYDLKGFEGAVDLPVTDELSVRIAAHKLDRDGYQKNVANNALNGNRYGDEHSEGVRLSVNFEQDRLSNLFVFAYDTNNIAAAVPIATIINQEVGLGATAAAGFLGPLGTAWNDGVQRQAARNNPWRVESDVDSEENIKNVFASNTTEFEINDAVTFKNIFGYRKVDFGTATDADGTAAPLFGTQTMGAVTANPRLTTLESEFFSDEAQLLGSAFDDRLDWIVGAYWSKLSATQDYLVQQGPGSYDSGISNALNTSYGLFAEGTYAFTDEWSLTAGIRQSRDERELSVQKWTDIARTIANCDIYAGAAGPLEPKAVGCEREVSKTFNSPTYRLSGHYNTDAAGLTYLSISTGYRAGGFNTRGNSDGTLQPFDEETVITYELGNKNDWDFDWGTVRTSVAAYWQDYEDIHHTQAFTEGTSTKVRTRTENAAKAEIKGLELDVTVIPMEDLQFNASYSYVDAQFKERSDIINGNPVDTSSNDFAYIPKQSATISATYNIPVDYSLGEMSILISGYWQDKMTTHPLVDQFNLMSQTDAFGNSTGVTWSPATVAAMTKYSQQDSYQVWNARFDWRNVMESNFDVAAYINNIENEQYVLGGLNVIDSGGYGAAMYGAPRTVGASVRYTF